MQTKTSSTRMQAIIDLYDMQTTYFKSVLEGIKNEDAHNRLNTKANHVAWLTGSLVEQRYELANYLGVAGDQEAKELFKNNQGIKDDVKYPSLISFKEDWEKISPQLREALVKVTDEKLDEQFEMMPDMKMSYYELISFISYREANCIGQIALWRRLLGYEAMKYM
jgi:hypothetical protein